MTKNVAKGTVFTTLHFLYNLPIGTKKLVCYITKKVKGLPGTNTLAF
jgi:hypothetical protein